MHQKRKSAEQVCGAGDARPRDNRFLVLSLGGEYCAMDTARVRSVLLPRPSAVCPGVGRAVAGLIFHRGSGVTVFDLGWILTGRETCLSRASRLVVLREPCWAALLVDGVLGLVSNPAGLPRGEERGIGSAGPFVLGRLRWMNRTVDIVDIAGILQAETAREGETTGTISAALDPV